MGAVKISGFVTGVVGLFGIVNSAGAVPYVAECHYNNLGKTAFVMTLPECKDGNRPMIICRAELECENAYKDESKKVNLDSAIPNQFVTCRGEVHDGEPACPGDARNKKGQTISGAERCANDQSIETKGADEVKWGNESNASFGGGGGGRSSVGGP